MLSAAARRRVGKGEARAAITRIAECPAGRRRSGPHFSNCATFGKVAKPIYWAKKGTSVVGAAADHANLGR